MSPRTLVSALDFLTRARGAQRGRRRQKPRGRGTKAAATLAGERLEPRLALALNPATGLPADFPSAEELAAEAQDIKFASGLPADMTASAYLFIGDHSVSNSEIWRMNVADKPLTAPSWGDVRREQGTFARGVSYPITVDWRHSNRAAGPDYDYRAWIDRSANPTWTSGSPTPSSPDFFVTDPGQLLQRRWFGSEVDATLLTANPPESKTADVHFPGIDLDVDSDNSGSVDGSPAEDALELVSTAGVNVRVSTASMAGLTPLVLGISDNLRHAATTGQVSFTFSSTAPTAFRLWRDAARTLPLPWGMAVTAAELGLTFGGRLNLQLEAVSQTASFAAITTTALVTGGIWQGTLQDTVRARGVPGVDLDVDSDNDGSLMRSLFEDREEDAGVANGSTTPTKPGLIVPVGGKRAPMIADVPQGRTASLVITQGADKVRLWTAQTDGTAIPAAGSTVVGGSPQTFWIEAFAPSASMADIAFTLTATGSGPASSDTVRATAVAVDFDVDSNNDGTIDPDNGPAGKDDRIEEESPGQIVFANTDDDDGNGVADVFDAGPVAGENDLARVLLTVVAPTTPFGTIIVTYDDSIVRLYKHPDRREPIASGVAIATGGVLYAEGGAVGTTLVTASYTVNATRVTDTVRLTVLPYPETIDVDIDSDNNNHFAPPARSEWEDFLEDHEYGVGKLIMLDNPQRGVTPIVLEIAAGLPVNSPAVGVLIDWDEVGPAGWVRLWNTSVADASRNPGSVHDGKGGNYIAPDFVCKLADLNYNPQTGTIMIWAEGIRENEQLKTLAGVEAARRVDERIRGTLVVNGDDAAFDEVKYIVANEDSFYHALHTRQEVRNALASRGVYEFADMPQFSLEPKNAHDDLGVQELRRDLLGRNSSVAGFKAMVYQDYITGKDQYVLAFGGTDDLSADWYNNFVQGFGYGAPEQYFAAMLISDKLASQSDIPEGHLIATGHSLGGGLASAAAVVGAFQADTFNAAWLRIETLMETDGLGHQRERYAGSLGRFAAADAWIAAYFIDYDIITAAQGFYRRADESLAPVGVLQERDGPRDVDMALGIAAVGQSVVSGNVAGLSASAAYTISVMTRLHKMDSVLYGLLVTEATITTSEVDMLGYSFSFL